MFVQESGPSDIFERIRARLIPPGEITGFLPNLLSCVWCMSMWTGVLCYGLWLLWEPPVFLLAISAFAVVVDTFNKSR